MEIIKKLTAKEKKMVDEWTERYLDAIVRDLQKKRSTAWALKTESQIKTFKNGPLHDYIWIKVRKIVLGLRNSKNADDINKLMEKEEKRIKKTIHKNDKVIEKQFKKQLKKYKKDKKQ